MLNLKAITKDYVTSSEVVHALRGVSVCFRQNEFVSILGPSGCGKTTLLNIVGGLDHYTDGDLVIGGRSTKSFTDKDWDVYRNHRVGFIFQSYNLIPHQTVLGNVELALTIAGISKEERTRRAKQALDRVGLSGQYHKRPNQLSGGQCQRVAIARALVNDPEILLADEPTGALDTVTSVQIMELIKEISGERLVIMVTHNPELADKYSSRIIKLVDGEVTEDSNPFTEQEELDECRRIDEAKAAAEAAEREALVREAEATGKRVKLKKKKAERAKMSFITAFMLSLKNLFTKKGRTTLTAFAGSIGIIGIALILAVSQGMTAYIDHVQETTLSAYPLTLESTAVDASELIKSILGDGRDDNTHENDAVYKDPLIAELVTALSKIETNENDLAALKTHIEAELKNEESDLYSALSGIQYSYNINIPIYTLNKDGNIIKSDVSELMRDMLAEFMIGLATKGEGSSASSGTLGQGTGGAGGGMMGTMMGVQMWEEILPGLPDADGNRALVNPLLKDQYQVVTGKWPEAKDEVVLVLNEKNELDDLTLYALGLLSEADIDAIIDSAVNKTEMPETTSRWEYSEIMALTFKTIFPYQFYQPTNAEKTVFAEVNNEMMLQALYQNAMGLKVVGIIKPDENAETTMLTGSIAYTYALTEHIITEALNSEVVKAQMANPDFDVLTGLPFNSTSGKLTDAEKKTEFLKYVESLSVKEKAEVYVKIQSLKAVEANLAAGVDTVFATQLSDTDKIKAAISASLGASAGVNTDSLTQYLEGLTYEELKEMIRPSIEEMVTKSIEAQTAAALSAMPDEMKAAALTAELADANVTTDAKFANYYDKITEFSTSTYDETLEEIGCVDLASPNKINLFASTFENKDVIVAEIDEYNDSVPKEKQISYTDFLGIMMSSITTIINAITYVLIAFVAISLVVSSIMIGVITLISVQERTKEIGVLRAIGASKKDVSSMFNAETIIIGLCAGLLGVTVTYLLTIPINIILYALTGIANLRAILPIGAAAILVLISVGLTLISGLIPSRSAAKKDPVVALRTE
ncbi:MAG: ABC transporter ATP-binding protein/permease [Clostridia bacterium]|nr:ABC transporter ATP-binding protein/permease [Clostridia bacterium]